MVGVAAPSDEPQVLRIRRCWPVRTRRIFDEARFASLYLK